MVIITERVRSLEHRQLAVSGCLISELQSTRDENGFVTIVSLFIYLHLLMWGNNTNETTFFHSFLHIRMAFHEQQQQPQTKKLSSNMIKCRSRSNMLFYWFFSSKKHCFDTVRINCVTHSSEFVLLILLLSEYLSCHSNDIFADEIKQRSFSILSLSYFRWSSFQPQKKTST